MKPIKELLLPNELLASKISGDVCVKGICASSLSLTSGDAFFALPGAKRDGHSFLNEAAKKGAAALIVDQHEHFDKFSNAILVRSSRKAFALAACRWFDEPTKKLSLVGLTGTNGKTTSAYLLGSIWERVGLVSGYIGTIEYRLGREVRLSKLTTPDALELQSLFCEMLTANVTHAVLEVSSHALAQERVTGSDFEVVLFTNLTQDHLDYHHTLDEYYLSKRKLFLEHNSRHCVINADDPWGKRLATEVPFGKQISFSLKDPATDFYVLRSSFGKEGTQAQIHTPLGELSLTTPLIGRHNLYNCLGVLAVTHALGHHLGHAAEALAVAAGAPGRLERVIELPNASHVFVDYAHTPDALFNVLTSLNDLRDKSTGRIITVFGCGGDRDRTKRPQMAKIASSLSDITIATSDNPRTEDPEKILDDIEIGIQRSRTLYLRETRRDRAIQLALSLAKPEDIVLVAGKGHETHQIIGTMRLPFDDRAVIREYYGSSVLKGASRLSGPAQGS